MTHFLFDAPLDLRETSKDIEYLKEQIAVATALQANPIIIKYMITQAEANAHDLLNYEAKTEHPEVAKSKLVHVQAANSVMKHYVQLANSLEAMVQILHDSTTHQE